MSILGDIVGGNLEGEKIATLLVGGLAFSLDAVDELGRGELVEVGGDRPHDAVALPQAMKVFELALRRGGVTFDSGNDFRCESSCRDSREVGNVTLAEELHLCRSRSSLVLVEESFNVFLRSRAVHLVFGGTHGVQRFALSGTRAVLVVGSRSFRYRRRVAQDRRHDLVDEFVLILDGRLRRHLRDCLRADGFTMLVGRRRLGRTGRSPGHEVGRAKICDSGGGEDESLQIRFKRIYYRSGRLM